MSATTSIAGCLILAAALTSCAHNGPAVHDAKEDAMTAVTCPVIPDGFSELTADIPAKYATCRPLQLRQNWADTLPEEAGEARIGATEEGLSIVVRYEDSDIFSTATANQQKMWTLGDVAEVFIKPGLDRSDYWEIHVTPNGFLMDLHIPSRAGMQSGEHTWEEIIAPESGTRYQVHVADGVWLAEYSIPWSAFGLDGIPESGTTWQFAVCRYNYNGGLENEELSSTAPLEKASYHRYEDYDNLIF